MTKGNTTSDEVRYVEGARSPEQSDARTKLRRLIQQQGVTAITLDQLEAMGDLWPENESVDDFIAAVREWRHEGNTGRLHRPTAL